MGANEHHQHNQSHVCTKEDTIDRMEGKINKIYTILVEGNGKPALTTQMATTAQMVNGLIALDIIIITAIVGMWFQR
jgi:hypothetical protein